jgi:tetratricopeptide (TPR) repeat protein
VAEILARMGFAHSHVGEDDEALVLFDQAEAIQRATLGARHPRLAATLIEKGTALWSQGKHDPAIEVFEQAIEILEADNGARAASPVSSRRAGRSSSSAARRSGPISCPDPSTTTACTTSLPTAAVSSSRSAPALGATRWSTSSTQAVVGRPADGRTGNEGRGRPPAVFPAVPPAGAKARPST